MFIIDTLFTAAYIAVAALFGRRLLRVFGARFSSSSGTMMYSAGTGFFALSIILFAMGMLGLYTAKGMAALFACMIALSAGELRDSYISARNLKARAVQLVASPASTVTKLLLSLLAVAVLSSLLFNYGPPNEIDDMMYHLSVPQRYIDAGRMLEIPSSGPSYYVFALNLLLIPLMMIRGAACAKMMSFFFGLFSLLLVYMLTRKFVGQKYALLAAVIYYLVPATVLLTGVAKIDIGFTFYGLLAVYALLEYHNASPGERGSLLAVFAVSTGMVLVSKMTGVYLAVVLLCACALLVFRKTGCLTKTMVPLVKVSAILAVMLLPWLARNFVWTGNPLYPAKISATLPYDQVLYSIHYNDHAPSTWRSWISHERNTLYPANTGAGLVILVFAPLFLLVGRSNRYVWFFFLFALGNAALLTLSGHSLSLPRFYHISFALLAIVASYAIVTVQERLPAIRRLVTGYTVFFILFPGLLLSLYLGGTRLPFILGLQSRDEFLAKRNYQAFDWELVKLTNRHIAANEKILYLGSALNATYYFRPEIICANTPFYWHTPARLLFPYLARQGINYVIIEKDKLVENPFAPITWDEDGSGKAYLELLFEVHNTRVYRIGTVAPRAPGAQEV